MTTITRANSPYKVSSGVTDTGDLVLSGGSMYVLSGGVADATTVDSGGFLIVSKGGTDSGTTLGGDQAILGLSSAGKIVGGGKAVVSSGGTDIDPTISAGGTLDVAAGGVVSGNTINFGTLETTAIGGQVDGGTIDNSGKIAALGTDAKLVLSATVSNSSGLIEASGTDAQVDLEYTDIIGGTLAASAGGVIEVVADRTATLSNTTLAKGTLLEVNNFAYVLAGGNVVNSGTISLNPTNAETLILLTGDLNLTGSGKIVLHTAGTAGYSQIYTQVSGGATLTNVDNLIAGVGSIGVGDNVEPLTFDNGGVVDADIPKGNLYLDTTSVVETNSGTLEATNEGTLVIYGSIISNTASGVIDAAGSDFTHHHHVSSVPAFVLLDGGTVSGGTLKATDGGEILAEYTSEGPSEITDASIATSSPVIVTSGGTLHLTDVNIEADAVVKVTDGGEVLMISGTIGHGAVVETLSGGSAFIEGTVTNSGTIFAAAAGSYVNALFATIGGGLTDVGDGTAAVGGGEAVTFVSGETGTLELVDDAFNPTVYSGQVSHFGQNIHQAIDLTNVAYVSGAESATFSGTTTSGLLTVTSSGTTVAKINLIGDYQHVTFTPHDYGGTVGNSGSLEITDPPASQGGHHHHEDAGHSANLGLLGNYIAGFPEGGPGGLLVTSVGESEPVPPLLVHPHG